MSNIEHLLQSQYKWVHIRYDSTVSPEPLLTQLDAKIWLYSFETITEGHSKDHVHLVAGCDSIPSAPTLNKYIDSIHENPDGINRSTSKVRTTQIQAMTYICKLTKCMKSKGLTKKFLDVLKAHSYEKLDKIQFSVQQFSNEHEYYANNIGFTKFTANYMHLLDKYLIDKSDPLIMAYIRKHKLHKHPLYIDRRAEHLASRVNEEI